MTQQGRQHHLLGVPGPVLPRLVPELRCQTVVRLLLGGLQAGEGELQASGFWWGLDWGVEVKKLQQKVEEQLLPPPSASVPPLPTQPDSLLAVHLSSSHQRRYSWQCSSEHQRGTKQNAGMLQHIQPKPAQLNSQC